MTKIQLIRNRIAEAGNGALFVASDFVDISDKTNVNAYLARLASEGLINRLMHGVYEKNIYNELSSEYIPPSADDVAHAIARNFAWSIVPVGNNALYHFGLTYQAPKAYVYATNGIYKSYSYNNTLIWFKKTMNKNISKLSYKTALLIQALKALGKDNINDEIFDRISRGLTVEEREQMLEEGKHAPVWIYKAIKKICG